MIVRVKTIYRRVRNYFRSFLDKIIGPLMAPAVSYMARSGTGTDACLKRGSLPIPIHYYSPIPDIKDLAARDIWNKRSDLGGIDLRVNEQLALLKTLGDNYGHECVWPHEPPGDPAVFYTNVSNFSYGCAAITHSLIRHFRPKQVIEIGSGNSSKVISRALQLNNRPDVEPITRHTIIDPYPRIPARGGLATSYNMVKERVELVDPIEFERLGRNDILFIDSGHTVRTGGDVNFLILDVLPRLAEGVLVHFHDISLPGEYPAVYFTNPRFRMFWTEAYLLQAFLAFNNVFRVVLAMAFIMEEHMQTFREAYVHYNPETHQFMSGSFWIQRTG